MENKILVAFATTHGSTQEIAEHIAGALREREALVELQQASQVRSLQGYSAVILGAPLYMFHLHKDALRFLLRHRRALENGLPLALFAGGPTEKGNEDEYKEVRRQLNQELAKYPWLTPAAIEIVGGKIDPDRLRFPWNLIPALKQAPLKDLRDFDAIRAWTGSLVEQFQLAPA